MLDIVPSIVTALLQLVIPALGGALLFVIVRGDRSVFRAIGSTVVYVLLPTYFFVNVSRVNLAGLTTALVFPVAAAVQIAVGIGLAALVTAAFGRRLRSNERRIALALGGFGNHGYLPVAMSDLVPAAVPAIAALLPPGLAAFYVGVYLLVLSPLMWSIGNWLITGAGERLSWRAFFPPPLIGILAGLVAALVTGGTADLTTDGVVGSVVRGLERLGSATVPMALMTLGGLVAGMRPHGALTAAARRILAVTVLVRFVAIPALFWAVVALSGAARWAAPAVMWVLFVEFHTPPATNLSVMVTRAGTNLQEVGFVMSVTYLLMILAYPFYLLLFVFSLSLG